MLSTYVVTSRLPPPPPGPRLPYSLHVGRVDIGRLTKSLATRRRMMLALLLAFYVPGPFVSWGATIREVHCPPNQRGCGGQIPGLRDYRYGLYTTHPALRLVEWRRNEPLIGYPVGFGV